MKLHSLFAASAFLPTVVIAKPPASEPATPISDYPGA